MILVRCGVVWLLPESGIVDRAAAQHDHCYLMENTSQRSHQRCMFTCTRHLGSWTCSYTNSSRARPSRATGRTMLTHTSYLRRKEQGRTSSTHARLDRAARPTRMGVGVGGEGLSLAPTATVHNNLWMSRNEWCVYGARGMGRMRCVCEWGRGFGDLRWVWG